MLAQLDQGKSVNQIESLISLHAKDSDTHIGNVMKHQCQSLLTQPREF